VKPALKYTLLALFALLVAGVGYHLYDLYQRELLWGHWPLLFLVALWGLMLVLFEKKFARDGWRWLGLATLSGALLAISFPPIPLTILIFMAFVPLLKLESEIAEKQAGKGLFKYVWHTFVTWNILTTWWVMNTAFFASLIAIWLNAFFMVIPFWLFHKAKKYLPRFGYGTLIVFWLAFEYVHLRWEISWPWLTLGNAFSEFPSWVQWYEWTGVPGGSFWILGANLLIFRLFEKANWSFRPKKYLTELTWSWLGVKLFVLIPLVASWAIYLNHEDRGRDVEVVVVQPNYEPHYEKFRAPAEERRRRFLRLAKEKLTPNTEYLVFPETSFWHYDDRFINSQEDIKALRTLFDEYPNLKIVTGIIAYHIFQKGEPLTPAARKQVRSGETIFWEERNAAIQLERDPNRLPFYIKSKLVPGAEITPYKQIFGFIAPLLDHLGGSVEGHGTQPEREAFESNSGKIAPVICYESVYGDYVTGYIRAGAEAIFIMTNDGWWDNTAGHKQHLQYATLRAIETRRSIARSANSGISCFINQRGDISQATPYGVEAAIRGTIKFNDEYTFYARHGDILGRLAAFLSVFLILNILVKSRLPKET